MHPLDPCNKKLGEVSQLWEEASLGLVGQAVKSVGEYQVSERTCLKGGKQETLLGKVLAQDTQDQVLSTNEIYLPQRDRGQRIRNKYKR